MTTTKVRFFTNGYAPCMVQALILDKELLKEVMLALVFNGYESEEFTTLLSWEDLKEDVLVDPNGFTDGEDSFETIFFPYFTQELYDELSRVGSVEIEMDAFDAAALYGYSAADTLLQEGVIS